MQDKLSNKDKKQIQNTLHRRLNWEHIKNQHLLIKHMSPNLTIPIDVIRRDQTWKGVPIEKLLIAFEEIAFIRRKGDKVQLRYENGDRIVMVTGIHSKVVEDLLEQFNRSPPNKRHNMIKRKDMDHWYAAEFSTMDGALSCKKYIRNYKVNLDSKGSVDYKQPKRRVRIVLLNEDFYTILVDAMMESKTEQFVKKFSKQPFQNLMYYPVVQQYDGNSSNSSRRYEDDADETMSFFEIQSKSSELYEDKMKDFDIEKVNQAIQYEKTEALGLEDIEPYGTEEEGIWTQTEQDVIALGSSQIMEQAKTKQEQEVRCQQQNKDGQIVVNNQRQSSNSQQEVLKQQQIQQAKPQQTHDTPTQHIEAHPPSQNLKQKLVHQDKTPEPKDNANTHSQSPLNHLQRIPARSLSTGWQACLARHQNNHHQPQQINIHLKPNTIEHETQTSKHTINAQKKLKQMYPSTASPSQKKLHQHIEKPLKLQNFAMGIKKSEQILGQQSQTQEVETIAHISEAGMKKKMQQYLRKHGRKQVDLPIYIKKENDRIIFKNKFLDQVIRQANQTIATSRHLKYD